MTALDTRIPGQRAGDESTLIERGPRQPAQDDGHSRWYTHPETGEPYLSVTWVIGAAMSKPWLVSWGSKMAAKYAVDFREKWMATFRKEGRDAAIKEITTTAASNRELKADVGTYEHDVFEALLLDRAIPGIPDHLEGRIVEIDEELIVIDQDWLDGLADGLLNFIADFDFKAYAAEATVASTEFMGAGTVDAMGTLRRFGDGRLIGLDLKSGAHLGPEVLAQIGAYDQFGEVWLRSGLIVNRKPLDGWAVLHLRASYARGYKLLTVTPEELALGWEWWQQCRRQVEIAQTVPKRFGKALYPPLPDGSQPPPMVEDLTSYAGCSRAVKPLVAAGFQWVADVALLDRRDVQALDGVGPKTVDALAAVLAECGLSFRDESKVA